MLQKYDDRNASIKVWIKDKLVDRKDAKVSVFDSTVQGGDAVWEGIRVYKQGVFCLDLHIDRMEDSARAMAFSDIPSREFIKNAIFETLRANGMIDDVHVRLTLSRGEKLTSGMDPRLNAFGSILIVLAEWKPPVYDNDKGIKIITSTIRRNSPMNLDSKIHHNNLINNILAKIQANHAGADDALMLDNYGFLAEMNGTNIFIVKDKVLLTPHADACLHGITRALIIETAKNLDIQVQERNISLTELYSADEAFGTGSMGELTPIYEVDGRRLSDRRKNNITSILSDAFHELSLNYCTKF